MARRLLWRPFDEAPAQGRELRGGLLLGQGVGRQCCAVRCGGARVSPRNHRPGQPIVPVDCRDVGGDGLRTGGARALRPLRSYRAGAPGGGWDSRPGSLRAYLVAGWVRAPPRRPPGSRKKRRPSARIGFVAAMMSISFFVRLTQVYFESAKWPWRARSTWKCGLSLHTTRSAVAAGDEGGTRCSAAERFSLAPLVWREPGRDRGSGVGASGAAA